MSQRVGSGQGAGVQTERTTVRSYEVNPLMPASLQTVPPWYEGGSFRHTSRLLVGVVPGATLLLTVTGTTMLTAILAGILSTLLARYLNYSWASMMLTVCHVIFLEMVNVYCMAPLIWRSVLNLPLYAIFHVFIAVTGILWWMHEEEFQRQDPRFVILLERTMFSVYPALSVTMVTWISGILLGRHALPFVVLISGIVAFSLYLVPLQSSFTKPNTPSSVAMIQHRFVVWLYAALLMTIPAVTYAAISYHPSLQSFLVLALLLASPPFLLSLLEAQGLGQWFGLGPSIVQILRMLSGVVVLVLVSACVSLAQPSSLLPLLLLPVLLLTMALISFADHAPSATLTLVVGGVLAVLYTVAFADLPWFITHTSSFLYIPLSVLQVLLWTMALVGVALMTLWSRMTPGVVAVYNAALVICEFILTGDDVYPLSISMVTSIVAIVTFWRLYVVGRLSLTVSLVAMCMHVTKLSLLFPCAHSSSPLAASLLPCCSTFLTSFLLLRLLLFDHTPSLGSGQLLTYSALILVGLLLSVDTILSPIWASLTHSLPSSPSLLATVLGVVALYVNYGLTLLDPRDRPPYVSSLPPSLGVMAALLWLLQPEFNITELAGSVMVALSGGEEYPLLFYLAAWKNLLTWLMLFSSVFALIQLCFSGFSLLTVASSSLLGVLTGFLSAISLLQSPPEEDGSLLYAAMLGLCGALCGRVCSAHSNNTGPAHNNTGPAHSNTSLLLDRIMAAVLLFLFLASYAMEWLTFPQYYFPGQTLLDRYAMPCTLVIAACSLVLAVVFRIEMYLRMEQPYLPMVANIMCVVFFVTGSMQQLHQQWETMVLLTSLVFLLSQPDGFLRPKRSFVFVAPCLIWSILFLYGISLLHLLPYLFRALQYPINTYTAGRVSEMLFLLLALPGHALFLFSLWTDRPSLVSLRYQMLLVMPHALLPQLGSTLAATILGSLGIFSFCLVIISEHALAKS